MNPHKIIVFLHIFFSVLSFWVFKPICGATATYITDAFEFGLKTGPNMRSETLINLRSGQPVEVFASDEDWSHIRYYESEKGEIEGFMLNRFLMDRIPWKTKAETFLKENRKLREQIKPVNKRLMEMKSQNNIIRKALESSTSRLDNLQNEYAKMRSEEADYLQLRETYRTTLLSLQTVHRFYAALAEENEKIRASQLRESYIVEVGIFICGVITGVFIGKGIKKR